jgi:hypothetical protein
VWKHKCTSTIFSIIPVTSQRPVYVGARGSSLAASPLSPTVQPVVCCRPPVRAGVGYPVAFARGVTEHVADASG